MDTTSVSNETGPMVGVVGGGDMTAGLMDLLGGGGGVALTSKPLVSNLYYSTIWSSFHLSCVTLMYVSCMECLGRRGGF